MNRRDTGSGPSGHRHSRTVEVHVRGNLDGWSGPHLSDDLQQALLLRPGRLIVDLAECTLLDHVGVLILLDIHRRAESTGTEVILHNPAPDVERVLLLAQVNRIITINRSAASLR